MQNSLSWNLYNFKAEMKRLQVATVQIQRTKAETLAAAQTFSYELNISSDTPNDNTMRSCKFHTLSKQATHITHVNHIPVNLYISLDSWQHNYIVDTKLSHTLFKLKLLYQVNTVYSSLKLDKVTSSLVTRKWFASI